MTDFLKGVALLGLAGLLMIGGAAGCSSTGKAPAPASSKATSQEKSAILRHTVQWQGESLALIAKWYTGDHKNWRVISSANPTLDPKRLKRGDIIEIPRDLVKTEEPMPHSFIPASSGKVRQKESSRESSPGSGRGASPEEEEDIELYGPKK